MSVVVCRFWVERKGEVTASVLLSSVCVCVEHYHHHHHSSSSLCFDREHITGQTAAAETTHKLFSFTCDMSFTAGEKK